MEYSNPFGSDEELASLYDEQAAKAKQRGGIRNSFTSGVYGLSSSLEDAAAAAGYLFGADEFAKKRVQEANRLQAKAAGAAYDVPNFRDIDSIGDAGDWALNTFVSNLPLLIGMGATGGLGGIAGAASVGAKGLAKGVAKQATKGIADKAAKKAASEIVEQDVLKKSLLSNAVEQGLKQGTTAAKVGAGVGSFLPYMATTSGENFNVARNDPNAKGTEKDLAKAALLTGAGQAAIGTAFSPFQMTSRIMNRANARAAARGINQPLKTLSKGQEFALEAGGEALTEGTEQFMQQAMMNQLDPEYGYDPVALAESAIGGGIVGGGMAAPGMLVGHLRNRNPVTAPHTDQEASAEQIIQELDATPEEQRTEFHDAMRNEAITKHAAETLTRTDAQAEDFVKAHDYVQDALTKLGPQPIDPVKAAIWTKDLKNLSTAREQITQQLPIKQADVSRQQQSIKTAQADPALTPEQSAELLQTAQNAAKAREDLEERTGVVDPHVPVVDLHQEHSDVVKQIKEYENNGQAVPENLTAKQQRLEAAIAFKNQAPPLRPSEDQEEHFQPLSRMDDSAYAEGIGLERWDGVETNTADLDEYIPEYYGAPPEMSEEERAAQLAVEYDGLVTEVPDEETTGLPRVLGSITEGVRRPVDDQSLNIIQSPSVLAQLPEEDATYAAQRMAGRLPSSRERFLNAELVQKLAVDEKGLAEHFANSPDFAPALKAFGVTPEEFAQTILQDAASNSKVANLATFLRRHEWAKDQNSYYDSRPELINHANVLHTALNPSQREALLGESARPELILAAKNLEVVVGNEDFTRYTQALHRDGDNLLIRDDATNDVVQIPRDIAAGIRFNKPIFMNGKKIPSRRLLQLITDSLEFGQPLLAKHVLAAARKDAEWGTYSKPVLAVTMTPTRDNKGRIRRDPITKEIIYEVGQDHDYAVETRPSPLITSFDVKQAKIFGGGGYSQALQALHDMMLDKYGPMVIVGTIDNNAYFASPENAMALFKHLNVADKIHTDIHMLARVGVLLKKQSQRVDDIYLDSVAGNRLASHNKKNHDGLIAKIPGAKLSQGLAGLKQKGGWSKYIKGMVRDVLVDSPNYTVNDDGTVNLREAGERETASINEDAEFGEKIDPTEIKKNDFLSVARMFPPAEQRGNRANLQQALFSIQDTLSFLRRDRRGYKLGDVMHLLDDRMKALHENGVPTGKIIQSDELFKKLTSFDAHTTRAYTLSSELVREDVKDANGNTVKSYVKTLPGTFEKINKEYKAVYGRNLEKGDVLIIHRDPALTDGSSMAQYVFDGIAAFDTDTAQRNGIVVHPQNALWLEAAGDFDGDAGVLMVPDEHMLDRATYKGKELTFVTGAKEEHSLQNDLLTNRARAALLDPAAQMALVVEDPLTESAVRIASDFSSKIGEIAATGQNAAEFGLLEHQVGFEGERYNLAYLLAKVGQASISAKKKVVDIFRAKLAYNDAKEAIRGNTPVMILPDDLALRLHKDLTRNEKYEKKLEPSFAKLFRDVQKAPLESKQTALNITNFHATRIAQVLFKQMSKRKDSPNLVEAYSTALESIREALALRKIDSKSMNEAELFEAWISESQSRRAMDVDYVDTSTTMKTPDGVYEFLDLAMGQPDVPSNIFTTGRLRLHSELALRAIAIAKTIETTGILNRSDSYPAVLKQGALIVSNEEGGIGRELAQQYQQRYKTLSDELDAVQSIEEGDDAAEAVKAKEAEITDLRRTVRAALVTGQVTPASLMLNGPQGMLARLLQPHHFKQFLDKAKQDTKPPVAVHLRGARVEGTSRTPVAPAEIPEGVYMYKDGSFFRIRGINPDTGEFVGGDYILKGATEVDPLARDSGAGIDWKPFVEARAGGAGLVFVGRTEGWTPKTGAKGLSMQVHRIDDEMLNSYTEKYKDRGLENVFVHPDVGIAADYVVAMAGNEFKTATTVATSTNKLFRHILVPQEMVDKGLAGSKAVVTAAPGTLVRLVNPRNNKEAVIVEVSKVTPGQQTKRGNTFVPAVRVQITKPATFRDEQFRTMKQELINENIGGSILEEENRPVVQIPLHEQVNEKLAQNIKNGKTPPLAVIKYVLNEPHSIGDIVNITHDGAILEGKVVAINDEERPGLRAITVQFRNRTDMSAFEDAPVEDEAVEQPIPTETEEAQAPEPTTPTEPSVQGSTPPAATRSANPYDRAAMENKLTTYKDSGAPTEYVVTAYVRAMASVRDALRTSASQYKNQLIETGLWIKEQLDNYARAKNLDVAAYVEQSKSLPPGSKIEVYKPKDGGIRPSEGTEAPLSEMSDDEALENLGKHLHAVELQTTVDSLAHLFSMPLTLNVVTGKEMYNMLKDDQSEAAAKILAHARGEAGYNGLIYTAPDGRRFIYISGRDAENAAQTQVAILSHEFGHAIAEKGWYDLALTNLDLAKRIGADFLKYAKSKEDVAALFDKTSSSGELHNKLHEYLADQIGAYLLTNKQPRDAAGRWYQQMATMFLQAWQALKNSLLRVFKDQPSIKPSVDVVSWMNSLAKPEKRLTKIYGPAAKGQPLSERIAQRRSRLAGWIKKDGFTSIDELNALIPEIKSNLETILGHRDAELLKNVAFDREMRKRMYVLLGENSKAAEQISKDSTAAAAYLYMLATNRILVPSPDTNTLLNKLHLGLKQYVNNDLQTSEAEANEVIRRLNNPLVVEQQEAVLDPTSPASRLYQERADRFSAGVLGKYQRIGYEYRKLTAWLTEIPYQALEQTNIPVLRELARAWSPMNYELNGLQRQGVLERTVATYHFYTQRAEQILKGLSEDEKVLLGKYLQSDRKQAPSGKIKEAATQVDGLLKQLLTYYNAVMPESAKMAERQNYLSMLLNYEYINDNLETTAALYLSTPEFKKGWEDVRTQYLEWISNNYKGIPGSEEDTAIAQQEVLNMTPEDFVKFFLTKSDNQILPGNKIKLLKDNKVHVPSFRFSNPRLLNFLLRSGDKDTHEQVLGTLNLDVAEILHSYIRSATKRAEFQRFLNDFGGSISAIYERARREGATKQHIDTAQKAIDTFTNSLGVKERDWLDAWIERRGPDSIFRSFHSGGAKIMSTNLQKVISWTQMYENISHLTLAFAAASIDPITGLSRHGDTRTLQRSYNEMRRYFKAMKENGELDKMQRMAQLVGTMENEFVRKALQEMYQGNANDKTTQQIMNKFFKYNGVEYITQASRGMSTFAAMFYLADLKKAYDNGDKTAAKSLNELGVAPEDIVLGADGEIELLDFGQATEAMEKNPQEHERDLRVRSAIGRFVDGSSVRPNSSTRSSLMSNPYYSWLTLWKGFTTTFDNAILKPIYNKALIDKNYWPVLTLVATVVPTMFAADMLRDFVKAAMQDPDWDDDKFNNRPAWKANWSTGDHIKYAVWRSGLYGSNQLVYEILEPTMTKGDITKSVAEAGGVIGSDVLKMNRQGMRGAPLPMQDLTGMRLGSSTQQRKDSEVAPPSAAFRV